MSRTTRKTFITQYTPKWRNIITRDHWRIGEEKLKRCRYANGYDGASNDMICGHDASHHKGYNSHDDGSKGRRNGSWAKRAASKARRRYGNNEIKSQKDF